MSVKKRVTWTALSAAISMVISTISVGAILEIKQETYSFRTQLTQTVSTQTFILSEPSGEENKAGSIPLKEPSSATRKALFTDLITVYFPIGSAQIDAVERRKLLDELLDLEVSRDTPLVVIGYTCQKGSADFNIWLSEERAKAVTSLLKTEGYMITKAEGRGESDPVSEEGFALNRRVEIGVEKR